jgi:hypothetical protein
MDDIDKFAKVFLLCVTSRFSVTSQFKTQSPCA